MSDEKSMEYPMRQLRAWITEEMYKTLQDMELVRGVPMSRLVQIAIDNELDQTVPFNYPLDWNSLPPYREFQYAKEAGRMLDFLSRVEQGIGLDQVILCRRQYDIEDRETAMLAYRELKITGMIEEYWPRYARFRYPKDYMYVRVLKDVRKALKHEKFKRFDDEKFHKNTKWKRK